MRIIATLLALVAPLPALALSCVVPSVTNSFQEVQEDPRDYLVVHGRLTLDHKALPGDGRLDQDKPEMTMVPAHLTGKSLTQAGFEVPFEHDITLEVACFGPWCGDAENGTDILAFVRRDDSGYALAINPCGGHQFLNPDAKQLRAVHRCFKDGKCEP